MLRLKRQVWTSARTSLRTSAPLARNGVRTSAPMPRNRTGAPIVRGGVRRDATLAGSGRWRGRKRVISGVWRDAQAAPEKVPKDRAPRVQAPPEQERAPQAKRLRGSETLAQALSGSWSFGITLDGLIGV